MFDIKKIGKFVGNRPLPFQKQKHFFSQGNLLHAPLSFHLAAHPSPEIPKI